MKKKFDASKKSRYFAFVVYEDNKLINRTTEHPREQLIKLLKETLMDFVVSPLHSPDEDEEKAHFHCIYFHGNTVSLKAVRNILSSTLCDIIIDDVDTLGSFVQLVHNDYYIPLHHPRNYQRYLIHLDQPEKQQFNFDDPHDLIEVINNFPLDLSRELTKADKMRLQREIEEMIDEYSIKEYRGITQILRKSQELTEHYEYLTSHTVHFSKYLDSYRFSTKESS